MKEVDFPPEHYQEHEEMLPEALFNLGIDFPTKRRLAKHLRSSHSSKEPQHKLLEWDREDLDSRHWEEHYPEEEK